MKNLVYIAVSSLLINALFYVVVRADEGYKEGKWEITSTVDLKAQVNSMTNSESVDSQQGKGKTQSITKTECVTHASRMANLIKISQHFTGCTPPQVQEDGGAVDFNISCSSEDVQMNTSGHLVYKGNAMQGDISTSLVSHGEESNSQIHETGKYIGPC